MSAAGNRSGGFFPAKVIFAFLGMLALLVNASPGTPHNLAAFFFDGDFVYDIDAGGYAVPPRVDRDKRQRSEGPLLPPEGVTALTPGAVSVTDAAPTAAVEIAWPRAAPPRFAHLEARTAPSRAPPYLP